MSDADLQVHITATALPGPVRWPTAGDSGSWHLPPTARAAGLARHHLRTALAGTCVPADLDTVLLLTSELVTNAVLHAPRGPIGLRLTRLPRGALHVAVEDVGPLLSLPRRGNQSLAAEGGRGLPLVAALSTDWGSAVPAGTTSSNSVSSNSVSSNSVWFVLAASQPTSGAGPLLGSGAQR